MQRKPNLNSFNLYEFLKHQNNHSLQVPSFLADKDTYRNAHINFPFRTFAYGLGITYSGDGDIFRIGSTDYLVTAGCLTTVGPGMVCQWTGNYTAEHDTVYFTEELFSSLQANSFSRTILEPICTGFETIGRSFKQIKSDRPALRACRNKLLRLRYTTQVN